jgi:hypothetical protein
MRIPAVRLALWCSLIAACSDDAGVRATDPMRLSSRGLYRDIAARKIVPRAFEYRPDYALWSDGADKRRWIVLPEGEQIDSSDMAHWAFPLGTKFFKEFSKGGKLLETRLIERVRETGFIKNDYFMGTFVWRPDQSDAILTADGPNNVLGTQHDVPRQKACLVCHRGEPGGVLGFSAVQLSASDTLAKVARRGWLSDEPGRSFELPGDDVQKAALGGMHANCGHCHSETGTADFMHLRFLPDEADLPVEALDAYKTTVGVELSDEWEDHPEQFKLRVVPGEPDASAILYRMSQRGDDEIVPDQMPPLATRKVDDKGVAAVRAWIESLAGVQIDDGGMGDAGEGDAGARDAGVADASAPDAGVADAGARDAGVADAGPAGGGPGTSARDSGPEPAADSGVVNADGVVVNADGVVVNADGSVVVNADGGVVVNAGSGQTAAGSSGGTGEAGSAAPVGPAENPPVVQPGAAGAPAPQAGDGATGGAGAAGAGGEVADGDLEDAGSSEAGAAGSGDRDVSVDEAAEHDAEHNAEMAAPPVTAPDQDPHTDEAAEHDAQTDESADHDMHADGGAEGHG